MLRSLELSVLIDLRISLLYWIYSNFGFQKKIRIIFSEYNTNKHEKTNTVMYLPICNQVCICHAWNKFNVLELPRYTRKDERIELGDRQLTIWSLTHFPTTRHSERIGTHFRGLVRHKILRNKQRTHRAPCIYWIISL